MARVVKMFEASPVGKNNGGRMEKAIPAIIALVSVLGSALVSVFVTGIVIGRYDEKISQLYVDRSQLATQVQSLSAQIHTLNDSTILLNASSANLKAEMENLRASLEHERQDRLDEERRMRFGGAH